MTIDQITALLLGQPSRSLAQSALPDAPVVPGERKRFRRLAVRPRG